MTPGDKHVIYADLHVMWADGTTDKLINKGSMPVHRIPQVGELLRIARNIEDPEAGVADAIILKRTIHPRPRPGMVTFWVAELVL